MFSNTAYEAFYQYIGLELHVRFSQMLRSQPVFAGALLLIFGLSFLRTVVQFFSRYMPGGLMGRKAVPLSAFFNLLMCLAVTVLMLKPGNQMGVSQANGTSWHDNKYYHHRKIHYEPGYQVSPLFNWMVKSADEIGLYLTQAIEAVFNDRSSQLNSPNAFYKAVLYSGAATLEDPNLRRHIQFYTEECFGQVLPQLSGDKRLDDLFNRKGKVDEKLSQIIIEKGNGSTPDYTCLNVKQELLDQLKSQSGYSKQSEAIGYVFTTQQEENYRLSSMLLNQYRSKRGEGALGIHSEVTLPTTAGKTLQTINRIASFGGWSSIFGAGGINLAVTKSQEFSEHLSRAPHFAGYIKMLLLASFSFLSFFVIAGKWRVLLYWWAVYASVILWTPVWTLLYHIMLKMTQSTEFLKNLNQLSDGISLYSAEVIGSQIYYMFSVYSWIQIISGCAITGYLIPKLSPLLHDGSPEEAPQVIQTAGHVASAAGKAASFF